MHRKISQDGMVSAILLILYGINEPLDRSVFDVVELFVSILLLLLNFLF